MRGVSFPQQNNILGKPENMTDDECYGLPVHHYVTDRGFPAIISCWELTDEDIEQIIKTRRIWANTLGKTLSPFSLHSYSPFE